MKEFRITLDLVQATKNPSIYLKHNDLNSVKFIFEVLNDGESYDLTGVTSVLLMVKRPSGTTLSQECVIVGEQIEIVLSDLAYNEEGVNLGELRINKNGTIQNTRQFEYTALGSITV